MSYNRIWRSREGSNLQSFLGDTRFPSGPTTNYHTAAYGSGSWNRTNLSWVRTRRPTNERYRYFTPGRGGVYPNPNLGPCPGKERSRACEHGGDGGGRRTHRPPFEDRQFSGLDSIATCHPRHIMVLTYSHSLCNGFSRPYFVNPVLCVIQEHWTCWRNPSPPRHPDLVGETTLKGDTFILYAVTKIYISPHIWRRERDSNPHARKLRTTRLAVGRLTNSAHLSVLLITNSIITQAL